MVKLIVFLRFMIKAFRNLGIGGFFRYVYQRYNSRFATKNQHFKLTSKYSKFPLVFRSKSSDLAVFENIFIELEYSIVDRITSPKLIVDCGANVGYAAAYLLTKYPEAALIALEPDESNFVELKQNLAEYLDRVTFINSAIWSHPTKLKMSEIRYRDGKEWSLQVRDCPPEEDGDFDAVDMTAILDMSSFGSISLLKMDVEGAECVVFGEGCQDWLARVDNIVIELHDDSVFGQCTAVFDKAIEESARRGRRFEQITGGELRLCYHCDS